MTMTVDQKGPGDATWRSYWSQLPVSVAAVLLFGLVVIGVGLAAMATLANDRVSGASVAALVGSVLGLIGAHIGHTTAHVQAQKYLESVQDLAGGQGDARKGIGTSESDDADQENPSC